MIEFHKTISSFFGFDSSEPSIFFKSNENWERDEEIKIFKLDDNDKVYSDSSISEFINSKGDKLIYIYDFLNYWTFFIDVNESVEKIKDKEYPFCVFSVGEVPNESPTNIFLNNPNSEEEMKDDLS
ncbi:uncharacterized protein METZ01_LOCUS35260 [marine metagenome]|uniref:Plasmid pRiA4b Orf3-like domain-containing protein n=1 Tax=marine metagenome TaxID=408172 RepID=A0A381QSP6_9ZZZZ